MYEVWAVMFEDWHCYERCQWIESAVRVGRNLRRMGFPVVALRDPEFPDDLYYID